MPKHRMSFATFLALSGSALAAEHTPQVSLSSADRAVNFSSSLGYSWIRADEKVYEENYRLSHLIWATQTPVIAAKLHFKPTENLTVAAEAKAAFFARSRMDDYDWSPEHFKSFRFEDWTDYSFHEDTDLERYIIGNLALGYDLDVDKISTLNVHGGFKYLNIKLSSYGGVATYSADGFRDQTELFDPAVKGISYELRLPAAFVGVLWTREFEKTTFTAAARLGTTIGARDIDNHWLNSTLFRSKFEDATFVELRTELHHSVADWVMLFAAAEYEKYFEMRGDTFIADKAAGIYEFEPNAAGAALQSFELSLGLKVSF